MAKADRIGNHLGNQTSPYLLQHAENPVNWYPWCEEAFQRAKAEDKPIFLSIGYSTCHWCHVMAHESFEDKETAELLNKYFISVKVDKEERPDIDSIYMAVCQLFTGSGGWPTSIFMTPTQKPFFAGTYFPKSSGYGIINFKELLLKVHEKWENDRDVLLRSSDEATIFLKRQEVSGTAAADKNLIDKAVTLYKDSYDEAFGGFGDAPKFPASHNLLFLLDYYVKRKDNHCLMMAETTLIQMYCGGLFDHIGYGFCRYSTDRYFLVPHFEKMLYDNALLILAYSKAYNVTKKLFYKEVAEKTAAYIMRELTSEEGGFYCAQDADSQGVEGRYYVFEPSEITALLGEKNGKAFNLYYDITEKGNFEGKNIPNLLKNSVFGNEMNEYLPTIYEYRKGRNKLHLDDKILTSWNSLMIAAMCHLYRISRNQIYLEMSKTAQIMIEEKLCEGETLYVSYRGKRRGEKGFLDDYANYIYALLELYEATLDKEYLKKAQYFYAKVTRDFQDEEQGGFYLYGKDSETLILRPKETYDGALPSGNSMMACNLVHLFYLLQKEEYEQAAKKQLDFLSAKAKHYPAGYSMFLTAFLDYYEPSIQITVVTKNEEDLKEIPFTVPLGTVVRILDIPSKDYLYINNQTTFYICNNHTCMPPVNKLEIM